MAIGLNHGADELDEVHDINVTPFIDVMLVLLIIFMVAAPLSTVDLPVDLPTSTAIPQKRPDKPTYLTIKADLSLALGETPVKRQNLDRMSSWSGVGSSGSPPLWHAKRQAWAGSRWWKPGP